MFFLLNIFVVSLNLKPYHGQDFSGVAAIERVTTFQDPVFTFDLPLNFTLFAGDNPDSINYSEPFFEGIGPGKFALNNIPPLRKYFQLVTRQGKSLLADKHLPLEDSFNFRDLGGIRTKDGRHVKWGKLFRSDEIFNLTAEDISYINSIPLKTVVDFRSPSENEEKPDDNISSQYVSLQIEVGNLGAAIGQLMAENKLNIESMKQCLKELYRDLVTQKEIVDNYQKFFNLIQNPVSLPLLFHCTAGKDRTGTAAFLILASLGVSQDDIEADYLLTNKYYLPTKGFNETEIFYYAFVADLDYLHSAIDTIKENYGSVENYLTGPLNVNLDRMKDLYLE